MSGNRKLAGLALFFAFSGGAAGAESGGWPSYDNVRYAFSGCYPSNLFSGQGESADGDGQAFTAADSWRVDESYVKVKGEWKYLYRAVSAQGATIDFYLSNTRNIGAATIFLKKALRATAASHPPESITTDKNPTYQTAITRINEARIQERPIKYRDVKYLNNVIEADHGKLKRLIKPALGFKSMKTAYATLKGFEVMRMFRNGQFAGRYPGEGVRREVRLINRQFGIYGA